VRQGPLARLPIEALLFALAAVVRLPGLGRPVIGDEANAQVIVQAPLAATVDLLVRNDAHPPLYFLLLQLWGAVSDELWWLRLPSLLLGAGACVLVYRVGMETFGAAIGRAAFAVAALSPLLVFQSQYLRPYVLAVFVSTAALLLTTRLVRADTAAFPRLLIGLAAAEILLLYTYYLSLFIVLAINLFLGVYLMGRERARLRMWAVSLVVVALAFLPWLPYYAAQMAGVSGGTASSTPLLKAAGMGLYVGPVQVGSIAKAVLALLQVDELRLSTMRVSAYGSRLTLMLGGAAVASAMVALTAVGWLQLHRRSPAAATAVLLTASAPVAAACALSVAGDLGLFSPVAVNLRYFGESAAVFTLVLGAAVLGLRPRALRYAAAGAIVLLLVAQLPFVYAYPFNYRAEVLRILDRHPNVTLIVSSASTVDFFLPEDRSNRDASRHAYQRVVVDPKAVDEALGQLTAADGFFFVRTTTAEHIVRFPTFAADFESALLDRGFVKAEEERVSDMLTVAVFERQASGGR